jgi:hypothetical protein
MYQPNVGLVVTISLDFLDKDMEYSQVLTSIFLIASQLGLMAQNKVDIFFEIQQKDQCQP